MEQVKFPQFELACCPTFDRHTGEKTADYRPETGWYPIGRTKLAVEAFDSGRFLEQEELALAQNYLKLKESYNFIAGKQ